MVRWDGKAREIRMENEQVKRKGEMGRETERRAKERTRKEGT